MSSRGLGEDFLSHAEIQWCCTKNTDTLNWMLSCLVFQPVVSKGAVLRFSFLLVAYTLELMKQCRKVRRKQFYFLLLSRITESLDGNVVASVVRAGRCCPAPAPSRA